MKPILTIIAGANGSGKSTLTKWARAYFQHDSVLDPDAIAVELAAEVPGELTAIQAGKQLLLSAREFLEKRMSFSVETTLSGGTYLRMMRHARELGYDIRLFYIGTESIQINLARVRVRVLKGGHDVPEDDQIRRYPRSFANLPAALRLCDEAVLLDNSTDSGHRIVGMKIYGGELRYLDSPPQWVNRVRSEY